MDKQPKQETKHKKYKKQKIDTYVSVEDIKRLKAICEKYEFRSIYQLLQYLVHCFLRVADPENDPIVEPIPDEIREMFIPYEEYGNENEYFVLNYDRKDIVYKNQPRSGLFRTPKK